MREATSVFEPLVCLLASGLPSPRGSVTDQDYPRGPDMSRDVLSLIRRVVKICIHGYWLEWPRSRSGDQCPREGVREKGVEVVADQPTPEGAGRNGVAVVVVAGWRRRRGAWRRAAVCEGGVWDREARSKKVVLHPAEHASCFL